MGTDLRAAARQALEALENAEEDGNCEYGATTALRAALEQPEQEPVAYWHKPNQEDEEFIHAQAVNGKCPDCVPLFTHPPRREWRSLSEEEVNALWASHDKTGEQITRAIEAALKERNA